MDGVASADFDLVERFIARHAIDLAVAARAMGTPSTDIARMIVDINVPRAEVLAIVGGCTPAKLVDVINRMNVLEMMMGLAKMRARKTPANQAHVTNRKEHPALLAADAAEAALRGFAEIETTVGVARYAPFNALAILVGSQTGRGGVLTQCAVEEATNLRLGFKGLTSYSETLSVYATESAFVDGDDTPWSKAFLGAAYASRGVKTRFTSGAGAPALMGHAEGKSMLYLEARSLLATRAAGSQGSQNGSISCIALPESLPDGLRAVHGREPDRDAARHGGRLGQRRARVALGDPQGGQADAAVHPGHRLHHLRLRRDPAPGQHVRRRQLRRERAGRLVRPAARHAHRRRHHARHRGARAGSAAARGDGAAGGVHGRSASRRSPTTRSQAATGAYGSEDMPDRDRVADIEAAQRLLQGPLTVLDVIAALDAGGFADIAANVLEMQRQRVIGDYLQPAAIFDDAFSVQQRAHRSERLPRAGHRLPRRGRALGGVAGPAAGVGAAHVDRVARPQRHATGWLEETGPALPGKGAEVVIAVGPAFGRALNRTIGGLDHRDVLRAIVGGMQEEGVPARIVRIRHTSDCAFIGHAGAQLSGSGIAIGLQSKGTTVIHRRDLVPLENLELFAMAPNMDLETYRQIGRNAALHALGKPAAPIPVRSDNTARLRLIVQTTLLHRRETQEVQRERAPVELRRIDRAADPESGHETSFVNLGNRRSTMRLHRGSGFSRTGRGASSEAA